MAKAVIFEKNKNNVVYIEQEYFARTSITDAKRSVRINDVLPFRIKFTAIGIENTSPTNVPAIPLQVIGFSNYIL